MAGVGFFCFTGDEIPNEDARVLHAGGDARVLTGDGHGQRVDAGLPLFEQGAVLQVVHHQEVGVTGVDLPHSIVRRFVTARTTFLLHGNQLLIIH